MKIYSVCFSTTLLFHNLSWLYEMLSFRFPPFQLHSCMVKFGESFAIKARHHTVTLYLFFPPLKLAQHLNA